VLKDGKWLQAGLLQPSSLPWEREDWAAVALPDLAALASKQLLGDCNGLLSSEESWQPEREELAFLMSAE
jgi:hypothetical protein